MAAHQVFGLTFWLTKRTLPSAMPTLMPLLCGEAGTYCVLVPKGQDWLGLTMNMEAGPVGCGQSASTMDGPQSGQKPVHSAFWSV